MNVNLIHSFRFDWPLLTNFLTIRQTRYIAHSFFTPTYLSPLHPSAAASASHPTYELCGGVRDMGFRALWSREGFWRGLFRGVTPTIASIALRGYVLSGGVTDAADNATMLASKALLVSKLAQAVLQRTVTDNSDVKDTRLLLQIYSPHIDPQRVPFATLAAYPLDNIRTLMQLAQHNTQAVAATHSAVAPSGSAIDYVLTSSSSSAVATVRSLVQQYGITAIYRGVVPALVGQTALIGSGLSLFEELVHRWRSSTEDDTEDGLDGGEASDVKEHERKVVFPLSLVDRLSDSPRLVSSALAFLSSYLLVFYPASVVSTHMRAATFTAAHVSTRPLVPSAAPAASHHLHLYAASSPPQSSSASLPGVMATIRRIGSEQGVGGFYRGFTLHLCKGHQHTSTHTHSPAHT